MRRTALALVMAAAIFAPAASTASPALAGPQQPHTGTAHVPSADHAGKPAHVAFTATGTITAVDAAASTVTVAVKGGSKDVRGKTVTIATGRTTRIRVNGVRSTLDDLVVGYHVAVRGVRQDTTYTATRIEAVKPRVTPSPTPTPSTSTSSGT